MLKAALAGAVALVAIESTSLSAQPLAMDGAGLTVTHSHIAQLKSILRLTPEQDRHWPAVEVALHALVKTQDGEAPHGFTQSIRARAVSITANAAAIAKVLAAAKPLIKSLDNEQRRGVMMLAQSLGIAKLASAL